MNEPEAQQLNIIDDGTSIEEQIAKVTLAPQYNAVKAVKLVDSKNISRPADITSLANELSKQIEKVNKGNMERPESLLVSQAHTLDALFSALLQKSFHNMGTHIDAMECYMRLALKAQNQCQATIRTLGELKNPKQLAFIKQANVSHGHQQINNGDNASPRVENNQNTPNKLLSENSLNDLDTRTQSEAVPNDSQLEAMGEINRAKIPRGEKQKFR